MGTMRERPPKSGRWELRVSLGRDPLDASKYVQKSKVIRARTKTEAKAKLADFEKEWANKNGPSSGVTVAHLFNQWIETATPDWSPTTADSNRKAVARYVTPALGPVPLADLTTRDLDRFYAALRKKGLAAGTVTRVHANISAALNQAVRWGWLSHNPATTAKRPRRGTPLKRTRDLPALDDVLALFDAAIDRDPEWGRLLVAKLGIGARRGEMAGLQVRAVDFDTGLVSIEIQAVQPGNGRVVIVKDVKQSSQRTLMVDASTLNVLRAQRDLMAARAGDEHLKLKPEAFLWSDDPDGARPWKPDRITQRFIRLRRPKTDARGEVVAPGLALRLHDLRHLNGTHLSALGVDLATISHRLGHERHSTTSDFYIERVAAGDSRAAQLLGERLSRGEAMKHR